MFDRVLKIPLKTFHSFAEGIVKTENPLSIFAVEVIMNSESMKSFIKIIFRNKQVNLKKLIIYFLGDFFWAATPLNQ